MIRQICFLGLGLVLCQSVCGSALQAQTIIASSQDSSLRDTAGGAEGSDFGFVLQNGDRLRAGRFAVGADPANIVGVFGFELPDLGAVASPFATADIGFTYSGPTSGNAQTFNVDLYGIDIRDSDSPVFSDFFIGPGPDSRGATILQEDILTPTSTVGSMNSVDIADYLNSLYDNGAGVGKFAFFRFSPDFADTGTLANNNDGYVILSANVPVTLAPVINFAEGGPVLLGDVNLDNEVDFSDISFFISVLSGPGFQAEADIDGSGVVNFSDISGFIALLSGT